MKISFSLLILTALLTVFAPVRSYAQTPAGWRDDLVDHLTGTWKTEGQIVGRDANHEVQAEWVLNHQFLRIHETTDAYAPASERRY